MAETYARQALGIARPRVAMMNIGAEEAKGTDLVKGARDLLKATPGINFGGYIEGRELFECGADVVVCDGMLGNVVLKTAEGMAKSFFAGLSREIITANPDLMFQLEPIFKDMFKKNDYHEHGGAPLLGVNGVCIIAHGSSEARSIRGAIKQCLMYHRTGLNKAIIQRLGEADKATGQGGTA
jgi:glycerol-3-phosphate acyltransferase PlsX